MNSTGSWLLHIAPLFDGAVCTDVELTRMWHRVSGEKPSCPGLQLNINLSGFLSITVTSDTGLGSTAKHDNKLYWLSSLEAYGRLAEHENLLECVTAPRSPIFTFDVDISFSGGGDTLLVVSFTAELSVLVHTCKWHIGDKEQVALPLSYAFKTTIPQGQDSVEYLDTSGRYLSPVGENRSQIGTFSLVQN